MPLTPAPLPHRGEGPGVRGNGTSTREGRPMTQTGTRSVARISDTSTREIPFISVMLPARNEAAHIAHTVERLFGQDYPRDRFEVLVADGRSTDETRAIVTALAARFGNL